MKAVITDVPFSRAEPGDATDAQIMLRHAPDHAQVQQAYPQATVQQVQPEAPAVVPQPGIMVRQLPLMIMARQAQPGVRMAPQVQEVPS